MGLDIRLPIGIMFTLLGTLLTIYGLATNSDAELYKRSLDININLIWGLRASRLWWIHVDVGAACQTPIGYHVSSSADLLGVGQRAGW